MRLAVGGQHKLAMLIGFLLGGAPSFLAFMLLHFQVDLEQPWLDPRAYVAAGGLVFSLRTVYQWGRLALASKPKAFGFCVIVEGAMISSTSTALSVFALVILVAINGIATGTTLARGAKALEATS